MTFRNCVIALLAVGLMFGSVRKAAAFAPPPPPPVVAASVGAGVYLAGGIIGVAAVLCIYDFWLKVNGFKNWDGSPKVVQHHRHR
jgi:H+/gluconate symporter-like permease